MARIESIKKLIENTSRLTNLPEKKCEVARTDEGKMLGFQRLDDFEYRSNNSNFKLPVYASFEETEGQQAQVLVDKALNDSNISSYK